MSARESARERAIRRAVQAAGGGPAPEPEKKPKEAGPWDGFGSFLKAKAVPNLAATRGDVIKLGKHRAVVLEVEWRDPTWAVTCLILIEKGSRLSSAEPLITYVRAANAPEPVGRWSGALKPGSTGYVGLIVPSDTRSTTTQTRTTTTSPTGQKEGGSMPTVVKRSGNKTAATKKSGSKSAAKSTTKPAAEKPASNRRTAADIDAMVPKFLKSIKAGNTMRSVKQEFGFSDDGPIRAALYRAGFTSKGEEHGEEAGSLNAGNAAGKKKVVALRNEGAGWYRLAFLTGLSEPEVKGIVADAGGPTGRVYTQSEKPAKTETKGEAEASARKGSGKKVTRRATKADPSKKG